MYCMSPGCFEFGESAKEEQLVLNDRAAKAHPKVIEVKRFLVPDSMGPAQ